MRCFRYWEVWSLGVIEKTIAVFPATEKARPYLLRDLPLGNGFYGFMGISRFYFKFNPFFVSQPPVYPQHSHHVSTAPWRLNAVDVRGISGKLRDVSTLY